MNKRKLLNSFLIVIAGLIVGAIFLTATNYLQLGLAIPLYLLLAFFFFELFPRKAQVEYSGGPVAVVWPPAAGPAATAAVKEAKAENIGIADIDKRAFLKLIGGAGIALFLFSIFNKRLEGLFFKNLPAPAENTLETTAASGVIDSSQNQPTYGYNISEIDDSIIAYYGFTNKDGGWFIMREDTETGSFRYVRGNMKFPNNWANRTNLKYDYYSKVFKL
ncbi:MAG: hypothetical protein HW400_86 [Candidatus Levybacteria bacterium]|nr:hypothetical protein [Candidatus Levybacteria bacterium]